MPNRKLLLVTAVACAVVAASAFADEVAVRGRRMVMRERADGREASRRVVVVGRGDVDLALLGEFTNGAYLRVFASGGSEESQLYFLEAAGWQLVPDGARYVGPGPAGNPVEELVVKVRPDKRARVRVVLRGRAGSMPLTLVPPDPGVAGGVALANTGRIFCVQLGGSAGGTITANDASLFRIRRATADAACPPVPTPFPTPFVQVTPSPDTATPGVCDTNCSVTPSPPPNPTACDTPGAGCPTPHTVSTSCDYPGAGCTPS